MKISNKKLLRKKIKAFPYKNRKISQQEVETRNGVQLKRKSFSSYTPSMALNGA